MKKISHKKLKNQIKLAYKKKQTLFIWGAPGIGKSDVTKQASEELAVDLIDVRITQLDPSDLRGLPKADGNVTRWLPPS